MKIQDAEVAVIGASLGGLAVANVLQRAGAQVTVLEGYPRGFVHRGGALGRVDAKVLEALRGDGSRYRHPLDLAHFYGEVWAYLRKPIKEAQFGTPVRGVQMGDERPRIVLDGGERTFDLIVGADGGASLVRPLVTAVRPEYAGYTLWRGKVVAMLPAPAPRSVELAGLRYVSETLEFRRRRRKWWACGIYMPLPIEYVHEPGHNRQMGRPDRVVPEWLFPVVERLFGRADRGFWEVCSAEGKVSAHPVWEMGADRVVNGRVVLVGDAAHMASPRTGAGAYTAMLDALGLERALQTTPDLDEALALYDVDGVARAQALYRAGREARSEFIASGARALHPAELLGQRDGHGMPS